MPRKPAILLLVLLFLSIGGAVFYQQIRKDPVSLAEVDSYLRSASTGDWRYDSKIERLPSKFPNAGWWDYLLIHRFDTYQQVEYNFVHPSTHENAVFAVVRKNGRLQKVDIFFLCKSHHIEPLERMIYGKFPELRPEEDRR